MSLLMCTHNKSKGPTHCDHNIIHIYNSILWDQRFFAKYSPHSIRMWEYSSKDRQSHKNIIINLNNVMMQTSDLRLQHGW